MPKIIHFEFAVDNVERAIKFYDSVFGCKTRKSSVTDYWVINTGTEPQPDVGGGIYLRKDAPASVIHTVQVPLVDDSIKKITKNGGKVIKPKEPIPGVGYFAYCQDTEGNIFGIMQRDPSAK
jgi:uncharacterized protein